MENKNLLFNANNNNIDAPEIVPELNINYNLIKQELDSISDKVETIDNKRYFYKNNGTTLFAVEDIENNTINIFFKVDYNATLSPSENRIGTLTIAKDFLVFNRDQQTGNLLCSPIDAAFLDLRMYKGRYKKILEHSIVANYVNDKFLNEYFNNNPNAIDMLDIIYHNSTDGYICKIGDINLNIQKTTKDSIEVGINILSFNEDAHDLGNVECPVYNYYRKKRDWYYSHSSGRDVKKSTENMKNCNFDKYSFSRDISGKYKELFDNLSNGKLLK